LHCLQNFSIGDINSFSLNDLIIKSIKLQIWNEWVNVVRTQMQRYLVLSTLAVLGLTMLLSLSVTITAFAQDVPISEESMEQHDGGDRAEYLQEIGASDPTFYVPPTN
jgi:hypothetical protein